LGFLIRNEQRRYSRYDYRLAIDAFLYAEIQIWTFDGGKDAVAGLKESWWFGISPEGFGTIAMIVNFVVAFTVKVLHGASQDVQDIVEHIRFLLVQEKQHIKSC
jgi:Na+(H+)/acetate symporter ActP